MHFDRASLWRAGLVVAGLVVGLLLFLWLFSMLSHFLFLLVLAWLFATALEPGIRWFVQRGRSRGVSTAIVGEVPSSWPSVWPWSSGSCSSTRSPTS